MALWLDSGGCPRGGGEILAGYHPLPFAHLLKVLSLLLPHLDELVSAPPSTRTLSRKVALFATAIARLAASGSASLGVLGTISREVPVFSTPIARHIPAPTTAAHSRAGYCHRATTVGLEVATHAAASTLLRCGAGACLVARLSAPMACVVAGHCGVYERANGLSETG